MEQSGGFIVFGQACKLNSTHQIWEIVTERFKTTNYIYGIIFSFLFDFALIWHLSVRIVIKDNFDHLLLICKENVRHWVL